MTPRIYFCDLAAYNRGKLRGVWIELFEGIQADDIQLAIDYMLHHSPYWDAEEWRIDDTENFPSLCCSDLETIAQAANLIHQYGAAAIEGYFAHLGSDADLDQFEDYYIGAFESEEDFCQEHLHIAEAAEGIQVFDWATLDQYIDWEAIANDAFINSYYSHEAGGKVHVYIR
ncbi:antirestriction protein ArdA [Leptolyngbya sp. GB1-A1]|uniref:antirestriction protein ArdA n=1 Tax=Leptolyngbya sp. GB1-A1 TaxID=2933908 RepID=UPI00329A7C12